ncbi:hypothetical protein CGJ03_24670 [Vibrio parahaemolyticus]|nr:hypothetical protein CGJ03_24670 [Vibrio parahaemolyticus]
MVLHAIRSKVALPLNKEIKITMNAQSFIDAGLHYTPHSFTVPLDYQIESPLIRSLLPVTEVG